LDLVSKERTDFQSLDPDELGHVFQNDQARKGIIQKLKQESGEDRLWYARLLESIGVPDLDRHLLAALEEEKNPETRVGLIEMLSGQAGEAAAALFNEQIEAETPEMAAAMVVAGHRISPRTFAGFNRHILKSDLPLAIKALATGSLYTVDAGRFGPEIEKWLRSETPDERRAGVIAAGVSGDLRFADRLKDLMSVSDDATILMILESLRKIKAEGLNALAVSRLEDPDPRMREAALKIYRIEDEDSLKNVIPMLGDEDASVADWARRKIRKASYQNSLRLVKSLSLPQKKVREALFDLLSDMAIKDLDIYRFVRIQVQTCYQLAAQIDLVRQLPESELQQLLAVHLDERIGFTLQTALRVLAVQDRSGRMHTIFRGILSEDSRSRANSLEAMDDVLERSIVKLLMPLLEDMDVDSRVNAGRRLFPAEIGSLSNDSLFESLLQSRNWTTLTLALVLMRQSGVTMRDTEPIEELTRHSNVHVSAAAQTLLQSKSDSGTGQEESMETAKSISLSDKILHLKNIEIFGDLSVNELAAVAAVTEEAFFDAGEPVFLEGEKGDTLYLVLDGDVAVIKGCDTNKEIELDRIGVGDYFGEMALFGDDRRSATIRVKKASHFLTLKKQELNEIVREFPQIALHVCRVLSMRIRRLHGKISDRVC